MKRHLIQYDSLFKLTSFFYDESLKPYIWHLASYSQLNIAKGVYMIVQLHHHFFHLWLYCKLLWKHLLNFDLISRVIFISSCARKLKRKGYSYCNDRQNCKSFKTDWNCDDRKCNGSLIMHSKLVIREAHEQDVATAVVQQSFFSH